MVNLEKVYKIDDSTLDLISQRESFMAYPYKDDYFYSERVEYSVGYGHQLQEGENYTYPISKEFARALLFQDLQPRANALNDVLPDGLTQNQFNQCLSLSMSFGVSAIKNNSVYKAIRDKKPKEQLQSIWLTNYDTVGGQPHQGLINRRIKEFTAFSNDMNLKNDNVVESYSSINVDNYSYVYWFIAVFIIFGIFKHFKGKWKKYLKR